MSTYTPIYMKSLWFGNQKYPDIYLKFSSKEKKSMETCNMAFNPNFLVTENIFPDAL